MCVSICQKNANTRYTTIKQVLTSTAEVVQTAGPSVSWKCSSRWTNLTATSQRPEDKRSKFQFPASQTEEYGNEPSKLQSHIVFPNSPIQQKPGLFPGLLASAVGMAWGPSPLLQGRDLDQERSKDLWLTGCL